MEGSGAGHKSQFPCRFSTESDTPRASHGSKPVNLDRPDKTWKKKMEEGIGSSDVYNWAHVMWCLGCNGLSVLRGSASVIRGSTPKSVRTGRNAYGVVERPRGPSAPLGSKRLSVSSFIDFFLVVGRVRQRCIQAFGPICVQIPGTGFSSVPREGPLPSHGDGSVQRVVKLTISF